MSMPWTTKLPAHIWIRKIQDEEIFGEDLNEKLNENGHGRQLTDIMLKFDVCQQRMDIFKAWKQISVCRRNGIH